jgi:hypothetical protein
VVFPHPQEVEAVKIYSEQGKLVSGKVVSGRLNASLVLTCKSFGGRPLPTHKWQLNGETTVQVNLISDLHCSQG